MAESKGGKIDSVKELNDAMNKYSQTSAEAAAVLALPAKTDHRKLLDFVARLRPVHSCSARTLLSILSAKALKSRATQNFETSGDFLDTWKQLQPGAFRNVFECLLKHHLAAFTPILKEFKCRGKITFQRSMTTEKLEKHPIVGDATTCTVCRNAVLIIAELAITEKRLGPIR